MRYAYLIEENRLSKNLCLLPFSRCFKTLQDICVEVALCQQAYSPNDKIRAEINLGEHHGSILAITMSLYIMIEVKDQSEL